MKCKILLIVVFELSLKSCAPTTKWPGCFGQQSLYDYNVSQETLKGVQVYLGSSFATHGFSKVGPIYEMTSSSTLYNNTTNQGIGSFQKSGHIIKKEIQIPIGTPGVIVDCGNMQIDVDFGDGVILSFFGYTEVFLLRSTELSIGENKYTLRGSPDGYYLISYNNFKNNGVEYQKETNVVKGKTVK